MITEELIQEKLKTVHYPGFSRDIVSFGLVKEIKIDGSNVTVQLSIATREPKVPQEIHENAEAALKTIDGIGEISLDIEIKE
ncbi:MAG: iron-sulfur cluster assembly protein, partial [Verrucomicrobiales bacterium]|nr:iron-sulfur cluster assembly protein [Verrucomicrobiales bacterium]